MGNDNPRDTKEERSPQVLIVPDEKDWENYQSDLDEKDAHDIFAGHTNHEMQPFFRQNVIERTAELRRMPPIPFRYYMLGFRDFVMAGNFEPLEASDAASCFLSLVLETLEKQPTLIVPIMLHLLPALEHVAQNQTLYEAEQDIYGNFDEKLARIRALYASRS